MFLKVCITSIVLIMEDLAAVDAYALEYSCMSYSAGMHNIVDVAHTSNVSIVSLTFILWQIWMLRGHYLRPRP